MGLTTLDLDVLLNILDLLNPIDIIHLGETCRLFQALCSQKNVWTRAVRQIRKENAVYPSLLPGTSHSLDQLRREATAPGRFISALRRSQSQPGISLVPKSSFVISCDSDDHFKSIRLIPGGHVLLTASSHSIDIWDLTRPTPQRVHTWGIDVITLLSFSRIGDEGLRIVALGKVNDRNTMYILDYNSGSSDTQIYSRSPEGWPEAANHFPIYHLSSDDSFMFVNQGVLYIWYFRLDTYIKWAITTDISLELITEESLNLIIMISPTKIYCYDDPRTTPGSMQNHKLPLTPKFTFDIPGLISPNGVVFRQAIWYGSAHFRFIFDIIWSDVNGTSYTFSTYEIHLPQSQNDTGCVEYISQEHLPIRGCSFDMELFPYRIADGHLFKVWYGYSSDNKPRIKLAFQKDPRIPGSYMEVDLDLPVFLDSDNDGDGMESMSILEANIDPASGRLCYYPSSTQLVVIDYV